MENLFKINLIPKVKDREWEVRNIGANRKDKICEVCAKMLPISTSSTTFTKRITTGSKTEYKTHHTCSHVLHPACARTMANKLDIDLISSFIN